MKNNVGKYCGQTAPVYKSFCSAFGTEKKLQSDVSMIDLSKWLIAETSKHVATVGNGTDVAVIDPSGFRWIEKH